MTVPVKAAKTLHRHARPAGRIDRMLGRVHHAVIIASGCSATFILGVFAGLQLAR